jgi:hypothetical protein
LQACSSSAIARTIQTCTSDCGLLEKTDRAASYLLTYPPNNANFNGQWRRTATVSRRNVLVRSRSGYLAVRSPGALPLLAHECAALAD